MGLIPAKQFKQADVLFFYSWSGQIFEEFVFNKTPYCRRTPKSKFLIQISAGSLASSPCCQHRSPFHPFTTQVSLSQSLFAPDPPSLYSCSAMFPQRCIVCLKKWKDKKKNMLFLFSVLCFVALAPLLQNAILLFLSNCFLSSPCAVPCLSTHSQ